MCNFNGFLPVNYLSPQKVLGLAAFTFAIMGKYWAKMRRLTAKWEWMLTPEGSLYNPFRKEYTDLMHRII